MAEDQGNQVQAPAAIVAPSPHLGTSGRSTRSMMYDVLIALVPAVVMSFVVFGAAAGKHIVLCVAACLATEAAFQAARRRKITLLDGSAVVTGLILALSLPWTAPWWIPVIGGLVAVGLGKMVFGGLGANIFNPAMVGRAFLMICFGLQLSTPPGQYPPHATRQVVSESGVHCRTEATPMTAWKLKSTDVGGGKMERARFPLGNLLLGNVNGSLGETSAVLLLIGGIYLCIRRTATWRIPVGVLMGAMVVAIAVECVHYGAGTRPLFRPLHHLFGGALIFGAFFIATDPVSSPISARGRWAFGLGLGVLTMVIRLFSSYPEGVMFSVLIMNSITPLINRWTIPVPVGGKPPKPKPVEA